ncbi:NADH-quinone oxidoreductase subunit NuoN [Novosphingobium album (ex Liu et al. 2023)]|uniref:NADH-quinone oxidoreductase subunit N n=1 Tax=Novosphingobium album (ex Liu et al. 2023) TaxID=3031130 RepID=A0ABT5WW94_9SPHN|nr:NADH-quinone oxidoreductase subunit NuoN [Novosphingobium album (ex Liu et al. 2023)]MDE8654174.1 NADH-quinone oxidoreductase subunit NuoN [Novosphingobium album (ex Liu et al. 2023)]
MDWLQSLRLIAPEETLSIAGLVLLLVAAWGGDKAARLISVASVAALVGAAFLVMPALCGGAMGPDAQAFGDQYRADAFASFAKLLIYGAAAASLVIAPAFFDRLRAMRAEYPLLILFAALGMGMMVSASNLLTLYIGLELNSLASYVLAAFLRSDDRSAEAGLKYFVLGSLASGILLFGISLTYGFTGTTSFEGIRVALEGGLSHGALFGIVFMLAGLAFKISAVPFHMWTPDVYEGAPTPVTTFFATAPKVAALALTMRVALDAFGPQSDAWRQIVIFASLASIVVGALGAIGQANIKRLMAYSSINNVGFMLIGLAAATPAGASAMLVYLTIYVAMSLGGFIAILMLKDEAGEPVEAIAQIAGLSRTRPGLAAALAMVMFSLAGIPPLFGFWGKFVVFQAAVQAGLVPLAAIGIAASVIGAFYYLKVVKIMYFDEPADVVKGRSDWAHQALLVLATVFISPLGYLLTKWLGGLADVAASALFLAA